MPRCLRHVAADAMLALLPPLYTPWRWRYAAAADFTP